MHCFLLLWQITRLGRYINDIRKKTSDRAISTRCRKLVKAWQQLAPSSSNNGSPASAAGYSPASVRRSNTPSHSVSPYLPSQSSSPALQTTYIRHASPATRVVSPLVRQATRNNGSVTQNFKTTPASPISSAYAKRISPTSTRHPTNTTHTPPYSTVTSAHTTSNSINANDRPRNAATAISSAVLSAPTHNNQTHRTPNVDLTNRVYAGNKKRRRSEESVTSDTSSIKRSKPLVNGEVKVNERVKTPRVKTTVQLIAELQAQNKTSITASDTINKIVTNQIQKEEDDIHVSIVPASAKPRPRRKNGSLVNPPEAPNDLSRTKNDMVQRFLQLQQENLPSPASTLAEHDDIIDVETTSPVKPVLEPIVDPYALLPPLDLDSITWSDDDEAFEKPIRRNPITGEYPEGYEPNLLENNANERELKKILNEDWHGVTGTSSSIHGSFHDWTDTFTISTSDCDKDIYVLPYVDI